MRYDLGELLSRCSFPVFNSRPEHHHRLCVVFGKMEEKVKETVEMKQRSLAEDNQKTLEVLKERFAFALLQMIEQYKLLHEICHFYSV